MLPFLNACNIVFTSLPWLPSVKEIGEGYVGSLALF